MSLDCGALPTAPLRRSNPTIVNPIILLLLDPKHNRCFWCFILKPILCSCFDGCWILELYYNCFWNSPETLADCPSFFFPNLFFPASGSSSCKCTHCFSFLFHLSLTPTFRTSEWASLNASLLLSPHTHMHRYAVSLSLSGLKHYKRESFQWAILSGEGDPNFGERKNLRIIANEARDALMGRRRCRDPRGFLIWLTCILILSTFLESGVKMREGGKNMNIHPHLYFKAFAVLREASAGFDQFPSPLQKWQPSLLGPDRGLARCTGGPVRREPAPVPSCPQTLINRGKYPMESLWEFLITQRPC